MKKRKRVVKMKYKNNRKKFWFLLSVIIVCLIIVFGFVDFEEEGEVGEGLPSLGLWRGILNLLGLGDIWAKGEVGENLVSNPGFEDDFLFWNPGHYPSVSSGTEEIITEGCYSGKCLNLTHGTSTWQGVSQSIGNLIPGETYLFKIKFKTTPFHYGYINLRDSDWLNYSCDRIGKSHNYALQGTGDWEEMKFFLKIPEKDDCSQDTLNHDWSIYLYSHRPVYNSDSVYYDDVSVRLYESEPQELYSDLEESEWISLCKNYSDNADVVYCPENFGVPDYENKISGDYSVVLGGAREKQQFYEKNIDVKPETYYKLNFNLKIEDRKVYNYLDLDYPSSWTKQREDFIDSVDRTHGIWSGIYRFNIDGVNILPSQAKDADYRSPSDVDWFSEEVYFKTLLNQKITNFKVALYGIDGKIYLDNLTVKEVESFIDDKYFHIPINEYAGMQINRVSKNPLFIETNAARFNFYNDKIEMIKEEIVSELDFEDDFLNNLIVTEEQGGVVLENENILMSVGADSTILVKLKKDVQISVSGKKPNYYNFEAGVIFSTDYDKGIFFSPLRTKNEIVGMPYSYDSESFFYYYPDEIFENKGLKFWDLISGFEEDWQVDYSFNSGDGFIAEIFPPKQFNVTKYCKERMNTIYTNLMKYPEADFNYVLQKFGDFSNIGLVWMNYYSLSPNDLNPPEVYCKNSTGHYVHCEDSEVTDIYNVSYKFDISGGPYVVGEPEAMHRLVNQAHNQNMKIIIYMAPGYYYTNDVDLMLSNLMDMINEFNLDGVYFDGQYFGDVLKSLELTRKTRNLLGDKFITQHISSDNRVIYRSDRFRVPVLDAYADHIWNGEGIKFVDEDIFRINFAGANVSNTVSELLGELRPVNYSLDREGSATYSLSPQEQIDYMFKYNGLFRVSSYSFSSTLSENYYGYGLSFDSQDYVNRYNEYCLNYSCGDEVCDVGETINSCPEDCRPVSRDFDLIKDEVYICDSGDSISQWILDKEPLYKFHFTFDESVFKEETNTGMNPYHMIGIEKPSPIYKEIDGEKTFYVNGSSVVYGDNDELNLTGKNFSSFVRIKRDSTKDDLEIIFALNSDMNFYIGLRNSKLFVSFAEEPWNQKTFSGNKVIDDNWHTLGIVYERPDLRLYVDGVLENEGQIDIAEFRIPYNYAIGALSKTGIYNFTGYIDDVFVSDLVLTDEQIVQYNNSKHKNLSYDGEASCIFSLDGIKYTAAACNFNDICEPELGEAKFNCIEDCPEICGDGDCGEGEDCISCSIDCGVCPDDDSDDSGSSGNSRGDVITYFPNNESEINQTMNKTDNNLTNYSMPSPPYENFKVNLGEYLFHIIIIIVVVLILIFVILVIYPRLR